VAPQNPYPGPEAFLADLRTIERSLGSHHAQALVGPRLAPLMRAVQVFGFHLATVDLRQSSDKHEAVVAELLRVARIEPDYSALGEAERRTCLLALLNDARPLRVHGTAYSPLALDELAIFETAHAALASFGRGEPLPGIADTVNIDHIKRGYYSIKALNPNGIVPLGPMLDWLAPQETPSRA
jgi:phosphoenolpyruvate carboxylase